MKRLVLPAVCLFALAACSKPEPTSQGNAAPATPPESPAAAPAEPQAPAPVAEDAGPSFDCNKASSDAETQVCADPQLAALDRRLAALYKAAQTSPDELDIAAEQRGWVKGRDACWQAVDAKRCLLESYQTRIVELQLSAASGPAPAPVQYRCEGTDKPLVAAFHNDLQPQAAVLRLGRDQAIVFSAPSASGARYTREGVDFWEHQGEVTLGFYGTTLRCRAAG